MHRDIPQVDVQVTVEVKRIGVTHHEAVAARIEFVRERNASVRPQPFLGTEVIQILRGGRDVRMDGEHGEQHCPQKDG